MEKLSIEEKAKAYDEAIERARIWKDKSGMPKDKQGILDDIFPELKENNDERIRKELIDFIYDKTDTYELREKSNSWLAWLEKQGKKEEPQVYETENGEVITYSKSEGYKVVEPKYNVGDWLVHNERKNIVKIVNHTPFDCKVIDMLGYHHTITNAAIENNYHLWTIQEAKNGDVLVHNSVLFIFTRIENGIVKGICTELIDTISNFGNPKYNNDYCPATKEQRDTLMKAMADEGYTFDFEKKELRKI